MAEFIGTVLGCIIGAIIYLFLFIVVVVLVFVVIAFIVGFMEDENDPIVAKRRAKEEKEKAVNKLVREEVKTMKYRKFSKQEKKEEKAKAVRNTMSGEGLYLYENNSDATLTLPKPTDSGTRIVDARKQFQGDNYYMQMVMTGHLKLIQELQAPKTRKAAMKESLSEMIDCVLQEDNAKAKDLLKNYLENVRWSEFKGTQRKSEKKELREDHREDHREGLSQEYPDGYVRSQYPDGYFAPTVATAFLDLKNAKKGK